MTEHSAAVFVFFFLAEYASIVLICILTSILFLGGYLPFFSLENFMSFDSTYDKTVLNTLIDGLLPSLYLGIKSCLLIFAFI
jgi:NADH-ubiquinone oxidoreductase chain 1